MACKIAQCNIEILGAAWGTFNVTEQIWSRVNSNDPSNCEQIKAADSTFGTKSGAEKYQKNLIVCYRYQYPGARPALLITKEKEIMTIKRMEDPPREVLLQEDQKADNGDELTILGAAWGGDDVTEHAQQLSSEKKLSEKPASNELWEKPTDSKWYHREKKILVVVYQYSDIPMMSIVKENEMIRLTSSPPLFILGAVYGCEIVTKEVQKFIENHELHFKPKSDLNMNPALDYGSRYPSFVMMYQYGNEKPILYISDQSSIVDIHYANQKEAKKAVIVDSNQLVILGAAYGLKDVTENMQKFVFENTLQNIDVNDTKLDVKDDKWKMFQKTLVFFYQYGTGSQILISITKQGDNVGKIEKILPQTFGGLIDSKNLVCNTDVISLIAVNNERVSHISDSGKLVASAESTDNTCKFTVVQSSPNGPFFLKDQNTKKFCEVDNKGFLVLKGDQGKTYFTLSMSMSGKVKLATNDKFVCLVDNQFLKADLTEHGNATTSFQLEVHCFIDRSSGVNAERILENDKMWVNFLWQATREFFVVLGLESFLSNSTGSGIAILKMELFHFISDKPNILKALKTLRDELRVTANETDAIILAIHFIEAIWKEGFLWMIFKYLRSQNDSIIYTEIFAQVIQVLLLPESEARVLLNGFTKWATQLMASSKKLQDL